MLIVKLNQRTFTFTQSALSSKVWGNGEREGGNINIWPIKLFGGVSGSALSPLGGLGLVKIRKDTINRIRTNIVHVQSGASSPAKHGGAYFSAVYGSIQDPIAAPGLFDIQVP